MKFKFLSYPTVASVPHSVVNGMKNLLAIAAATEITFKEAETVKAFLADPSAFAAVAAPAAAAAMCGHTDAFYPARCTGFQQNLGDSLQVRAQRKWMRCSRPWPAGMPRK